MVPLCSALLIAILSLVTISSAHSDEFAYIANEASGTVSVVDTYSDAVTATLDVGTRPRGIAASMDGARLYIADQTGAIERDLFTNKSVRIGAGESAKAVQVSPDGKRLAVVVGDDDAVILIDMATLRTLKTLRLSGRKPDHIAFSPNGRWLYASADAGDRVDVIDVVRGSVQKSIDVGHGPTGIAFLPDGTRAYVAVGDKHEIAVIDVALHEIVARVRSTSPLGSVAAHPDGARVFVAAPSAGSVQVLDVKMNKFIANVDVGGGPSAMRFTVDGSKLYVACRRANEVAVIDTSTYKSMRSISVGAKPSGIVMSERPVLPRDGD